MDHTVTRWLYRLDNSRAFSSIRKGFVMIIPILMTGALALLATSIPLPGYVAFLETLCGGAVLGFLNGLVDVTFGFMSLYLAVSISYQYAGRFVETDQSLRIMACFVTVGSLLACLGEHGQAPQVAEFGTTGVFAAMVCAIAGTKLFFMLLFALFHPEEEEEQKTEATLYNAMRAILPMLMCLAVFWLVNLGIRELFGVANFNQLIAKALNGLFARMHGELAAGMRFIFLLNLLWWFGMHGGNLLEQVALTVFLPTTAGGLLSKTFFDNFAVMGGCGGTLCLLVALLIAARSRERRRLARSALPFALFNINEIMVFGYPLVLNPLMLVPFLAVPMVSLLTSYLFTLWGIVPVVTSTVTWTTPVLISGYIATGSFWGVAVQLLNIVLGTMIYLPFVRLSERLENQHDAYLLEELTTRFKEETAQGRTFGFFQRRDHLSALARDMATQLKHDIQADRIPVMYQPQVLAGGQCVGAEALLRWQYQGQTLFPPLVVALSQADGSYDALTQRILKTVCQDTIQIAQALEACHVSANITAEQLGDLGFIRSVVELAEQQGVADSFGLEVTEEGSLLSQPHLSEALSLLRAHGISVAIDDFSMGQTSLQYLQNGGFRFVKLDGALVRQSDENERSREIIHSIIELGRTLDFRIIAEQVETPDTLQNLAALGCKYFQGFLFGRAMPLPVFLQWAERQNAK